MMSKSRTTIDSSERRRRLAPIHPGEILSEDLQDAGISLNQLARSLRVPMNRISAIVNSKRSITADTAMRLARYFGTTERFWLNLQARFDLEVQRDVLGARLAREVRVLDRAS